jgi:hypothetical protein
MATMKDLTKEFPGWEFIDEEEEHRLDHIKGQALKPLPVSLF